jgi:hypothetical protein
MERPALQGLLVDIRAGRIDILVIYKVDRLTQSLANFARLVEIFDAQDATFVPLRSSSIRRANPGLVKAASHQFHALLQSTSRNGRGSTAVRALHADKSLPCPQ